MTNHKPFTVEKKKLANGFTILAKPNRTIPRVEIQLWYNVGSKDEAYGEKGMAHLIEHMLFKGTKNFSEMDLNQISHKLAGEANAFTSQDYTCFTFTLPSTVWHEALPLLAECMQHATFNPEMLASEVKAVIEELRLYRDDYQNTILEKMVASAFPEHPYHYPIIGSRYDLCMLERDTLVAFYKKHYHPGNATLVVVGDIDPKDVFKRAQEHFEPIPAATDYVKKTFHFEDDVEAKTTTVYRQISNPWGCYAYKVPGFDKGQNYIFDIVSLILANGKSSRLYKKLVDQKKLATDVDCFVYDFFERGLFGITVYPTNPKSIPLIEKIIEQEIALLSKKLVEDWEFLAAKNHTHVDYTTFLEYNEKQANIIGASFLATGNEQFIERYLENIQNVTKEQIKLFFAQYCTPSLQHRGYLLPLGKEDHKKFAAIQKETDALEKTILAKHVRTLPLEPGKWVHKIKQPKPTVFSYPKPESFTLENGLNVIFYNNPNVPQISAVLSLKANYLYDDPALSGIFNFLIRILTDRTAKHSAEELNRILETSGVYINSSGDVITLKCLSKDLVKGLEMIKEMILHPSFDKKTIEKIRSHMMSELDEFWDTPIEFIEQLAKEAIYQKHPYSKNPLGTKKSIKKIAQKNLKKCYQTYVSPQEATLVIVGDLQAHDVRALAQKIFGAWRGPVVPDLVYPPIVAPKKAALVTHKLSRDQVVLAFVAPSLARTSDDYTSAALLDIILTGGAQGSSSSRLFALRELEGLFYAIGGSIVYNAREDLGIILIKTIVSADKVQQAQELIQKTIEILGNYGVTDEEFLMAKNLLFTSSVELFESNAQMMLTFLFLKKFKLSFDLFDKQGELLSILKIGKVNEVAQQLCAKQPLTIIRVGNIAR